MHWKNITRSAKQKGDRSSRGGTGASWGYKLKRGDNEIKTPELYSTQSSVIIYMRKEAEKAWIYEYIYEYACNAGDTVSIIGSGSSPEGGNGNKLQYSCLENFMNTAVWQARSMKPQRVLHD